MISIPTPAYLPDAEVADFGETYVREYIRVLRLVPKERLASTEEERHEYKLARAEWELSRLCPAMPETEV